MLTPQEENVLRQLAKDNTPLARPAQDTGFRAVSRDDTLDRKVKNVAKMKVNDLSDDFAVTSKLERAGVLRRNEKPGQFYARTGLGRASILEWSPGEIKRFVEVREANAADEIPAPPIMLGVPQPPAGVRAVLVG
jgi:hypothetical protein